MLIENQIDKNILKKTSKFACQFLQLPIFRGQYLFFFVILCECVSDCLGFAFCNVCIVMKGKKERVSVSELNPSNSRHKKKQSAKVVRNQEYLEKTT